MDVPCVYHSWDETKDGEDDVDEEICYNECGYEVSRSCFSGLIEHTRPKGNL